MVNGPLVVEAQPRVSLPFGLFSVLTFRESSDPHWLNGIEWQALTCDPALSYDVACEDPDEDPETVRLRLWAEDAEATGGRGNAQAFNVYGFAKCGLPGGRDLQRGEEEATAQLLAREEAQAEAQAWGRMSAEAVDLNPAGPLSPARALATLERWMGGTYGSLGAIHADRGAATLLDTHIAPSGPRLLTKVGTPIVAGAGYPGAGPLPGTDEVQTVAVSGGDTGGTFTLTLGGETTAPIAFNATAAAVQAALLALPGVFAGDTATSGGPLPGAPVAVTFGGRFGDRNVPAMTASGAGLTGTAPTATVTTTTGGAPPPADPDVAWMYASPALFGYRGPVYASDREGGFDRGTNDHYAVATRGYVVGFDPCGVGAVRMDLNG